MNKAQLIDFLKQNKTYFLQQFGVIKIGVFGSYVLDEADDKSDIDIAIEMKPEHKFRNFFSFKRYLEDHLHKKIDLGIESALKPLVRQSIKNHIVYV